MSNKKLALMGIVSYLLEVLTSATDQQGNSVVPIYLVLISGILALTYFIFVVRHLWRKARPDLFVYIIVTVLLIILSIIQQAGASSYGSPFVIFLNLTKVANFL